MHVVEAQVTTEQAGRYLIQLCKHFAHKAPTNYSEHHGRVDFIPGSCVMQANGNLLSLRCEASTEPDLDVVKEIVEVHLQRFARSEVIALTWRDGTQPIAVCGCAH